MPIFPAPAVVPTTDTDTPIDKTLAVANTAEDLVAVPALKVGRTLSIINDGPGSIFIAFDDTAVLTDTQIKRGETYGESGLEIATNVSFIGEVGRTPTVRGILWSGD